MIFKPLYYFDTGYAACIFGWGTIGKGAAVDQQERDLGNHIASAEESRGTNHNTGRGRP